MLNLKNNEAEGDRYGYVSPFFVAMNDREMAG